MEAEKSVCVSQFGWADFVRLRLDTCEFLASFFTDWHRAEVGRVVVDVRMAAAPQEEQLVKAVEIASNAAAMQDADLTAQALVYLEQLKQATHESWGIGWAIWTARSDDGTAPMHEHAPRLFGLNLVDDFLDRRYVAIACMPRY